MTKITYENTYQSVKLGQVETNGFFVYEDRLWIKFAIYTSPSVLVDCLDVQYKTRNDLSLQTNVYLPLDVDIKVTY